MILFHEFYGKPTIQQINSFLKGMSHLISVKDAAEYIRNHFNLKKVKLNSTATKVMSFEQFISEEKEIKVGGYQTTHHYMCPSAVKFIKKHMRMDHDMQDLEDIARLSDDVFKIEAEVEKSGKVSDKQIKSAQRLTDMVYDIIEKMGHKKSEASYMDLHMDAIKNPDKAGSMKG